MPKVKETLTYHTGVDNEKILFYAPHNGPFQLLAMKYQATPFYS